MKRAPVLALTLAWVALAAGLTLAACNAETLADDPCPEGGTTLTYANFGEGFMSDYCNGCHSAPDGQRNGAPDDYVFDTLAEVQQNAAIIFVNAAGTNEIMPPGPDDIPDQQRRNLATWLACGAK